LDFEILQDLAVATGIGLLVGVERGWRERKAGPGMRTAGIRTFTLIGLLGGIFGAIAKSLDEPTAAAIVIAIGVLALTAVFATFRLRELEREKAFGATTVVAAMATFALGTYALFGDEIVAAAVGVAMVAVLAAREGMHGWLARITWPELRAAIVLAAMTFIALPIIPDESYGPFGGINFRQIWLLAVILAAVSFVGYAAVKRFGAGQGLLLGAAAGGLVSSTAVNVTAARRAAKGEAEPRLLAASSTLATGVSFMRTIVLIAALNVTVALYAVGPLLTAALASLVMAYLLGRQDLHARSKAMPKLRNPFSLRETLILAGILGVVKIASGAATEFFGTAGALAVAFIAGIADTDAITFSMSELGRAALEPPIAGMGIAIANASNSLFKLVFGLGIAGRSYVVPLAAGLGFPVLAGAAVVPFLLLG
jgi:uncharacterized membrane protein (DUF4010 family)